MKKFNFSHIFLVFAMFFSFIPSIFAQDLFDESDQIWYETRISKDSVVPLSKDANNFEWFIKEMVPNSILAYEKNMLGILGIYRTRRVKTVTIPLTEWKLKNELEKYKVFFQKNGFPLSDRITLIKVKGLKKIKRHQSAYDASPYYDDCEYDDEVIKYNDQLLVLYGGYLAVYSKDNPHKELGINCKYSGFSGRDRPVYDEESVCYYPHQDLLSAYETYAVNAYKVGAGKLRHHIVPMKNIHYGRLDEGPYGGTKYEYKWENPKKLTVFLTYPGAGKKLEFEEKGGATSVTCTDFMQSTSDDD